MVESLGYIARVLRDPVNADDVGVAVEFILPQTAKRIDVIQAGHADDGSRRLVMVDLAALTFIDCAENIVVLGPRLLVIRISGESYRLKDKRKAGNSPSRARAAAQ
ncbi:hypothetical protein [Bordetella genomosp. 13]|uniref:hypothetical protein n=1 Tax=Bordetella genomosp. 13 TaxID=463040 RepID=UPI0022B7623C|nr:hypothetical protein [Bordetella genomosp. 13]